MGFKTKFRWKFGESITGVHLDAVIGATASVGWLKGAVVGRAMEGDELVEAISDTLEGAASSVYEAV